MARALVVSGSVASSSSPGARRRSFPVRRPLHGVGGCLLQIPHRSLVVAGLFEVHRELRGNFSRARPVQFLAATSDRRCSSIRRDVDSRS
jgi:hypothetical protein